MRLRGRELDWREIEGETVVLDVQRSLYLAVNAAGTLLWKRLADGATRAELIHCLMEAFSLDQQRAEADVDEFVALLRAHELVAG